MHLYSLRWLQQASDLFFKGDTLCWGVCTEVMSMPAMIILWSCLAPACLLRGDVRFLYQIHPEVYFYLHIKMHLHESTSFAAIQAMISFVSPLNHKLVQVLPSFIQVFLVLYDNFHLWVSVCHQLLSKRVDFCDTVFLCSNIFWEFFTLKVEVFLVF